MKKFKTRQHAKDIKVCGAEHGSPLIVMRTKRKDLLKGEVYHSHEKGYEYYLILAGRAIMKINGEQVPVRKDDVVMVHPGEKHQIEKILEELDYIVIKTNTDPKDKKHETI